LAALISTVVASFGVATDAGALAEVLLLVFAGVSNLVSMYGTAKRATKIDLKRVLPGVTRK
jgi:hypothetical protein